MRSLCRLPVAKNHNFGQILTFLGLLYRPPFVDKDQTWCAIADPWYTLMCLCLVLSTNLALYNFFYLLRQMSSRSVYSVALWRRKTPLFAVFFAAFSVVANCQQSDKVEHGYTTTNLFPYPTVTKSFLYSNAFMAKSGAQSLTFKSVMNRQTDKKTQRFWHFWPPRRQVKSKPHPTWHGDRGPRARSCTSKAFEGLTHSFAARGR